MILFSSFVKQAFELFYIELLTIQLTDLLYLSFSYFFTRL